MRLATALQDSCDFLPLQWSRPQRILAAVELWFLTNLPTAFQVCKCSFCVLRWFPLDPALLRVGKAPLHVSRRNHQPEFRQREWWSRSISPGVQQRSCGSKPDHHTKADRPSNRLPEWSGVSTTVGAIETGTPSWSNATISPSRIVEHRFNSLAVSRTVGNISSSGNRLRNQSRT